MQVIDKVVSFFIDRLPNKRIISEYHKRGNGKGIDYTRQAIAMHAKAIEDYQMAMMAATDPDNPRRGDLMRFYRSMMTDLHLGSCIESRILPVQCAPYKLVDRKDNENIEAKKLLDKPWHLELIKLVCRTEYEGTKLIEMTDLNDSLELKSVSEIPQSNFLPHKGIVIKEEYDEQGISYRTGRYRDYYLQIGGDWELGLFSQLAVIVLAKKMGLGSWMGYIDKFGVPPIFAITDRLDTDRRDELFDMLQNFRQNQFAVLQGNERIEVPSNYQVDAYNTFEALIKVADAQLSKRILGGTGITDEKSFVGSAEVQERILKYRQAVDKLHYKYNFNEEIKPRLIRISPVYSVLEPLTLEWDESESLTLKEFLQAVKDLAPYFEFDVVQLNRITGLPITQLKQAAGIPADTGDGVKKKPESKLNLNTGPVAITGSDWDKLVERIARQLHDGEIKPEDLDRELILETYGELSKGAQSGWGQGFFDTASGQKSIQQNMRENLFWFSGAKTFQELDDLNKLLLDDEGNVRPWHEFRKEAIRTGTVYNETYLRTEYDGVVNSSRSARDWQKFEKDKAVYPRLKYRTMSDDAVRPEHALLEGVIRPVDDSYWNTYTPPKGYRCRCWLEQTTEPETPPVYDTVDPRFANNPGKTGLVYNVMHPYFSMSREQLSRVKHQTELAKLYAPYEKLDGESVWINHFADARDLPSNLEAARTLAANHAARVKIRPHIEPGEESIKNPELYVNNKTGELKKISGKQGLNNGFKSAKRQECEVTVFRLDYDTLDTGWITRELSRIFSPNRGDQQPDIAEFYLIRGNRSVRITRDEVLEGKHHDIIEKLKG